MGTICLELTDAEVNVTVGYCYYQVGHFSDRSEIAEVVCLCKILFRLKTFTDLHHQCTLSDHKVVYLY